MSVLVVYRAVGYVVWSGRAECSEYPFQEMVSTLQDFASEWVGCRKSTPTMLASTARHMRSLVLNKCHL